jgi:predicted transposase YdaD
MLEESAKRWVRQLLQEGRQEGRQEGIDGTRELLLQQIKLRFGRVPRTVRQRIEGISSMRELRALGRKVILAETLQDLGLC